jgi:hypothetical protein
MNNYLIGFCASGNEYVFLDGRIVNGHLVSDNYISLQQASMKIEPLLTKNYPKVGRLKYIYKIK